MGWCLENKGFKKLLQKVQWFYKERDRINKSVHRGIYCILGAQARTKQSVYGERASALKTQSIQTASGTYYN